MSRPVLSVLLLVAAVAVGYLSLVSRPSADRILTPERVGEAEPGASDFATFDASYPRRTVTGVREVMHQVTVWAIDHPGQLGGVSMARLGYSTDASGAHLLMDGSSVRIDRAAPDRAMVVGVGPEGHVVRGIVQPGQGSSFTVQDADGRSLPSSLGSYTPSQEAAAP